MIKFTLVNIACHTSADLLAPWPADVDCAYRLSLDEIMFFRSTLSPYLNYSYFGVLGEYGEQRVVVYPSGNAIFMTVPKFSAE